MACCAASLAAAVAQNGYFDENVAPAQQLINALALVYYLYILLLFQLQLLMLLEYEPTLNTSDLSPKYGCSSRTVQHAYCSPGTSSLYGLSAI